MRLLCLTVLISAAASAQQANAPANACTLLTSTEIAEAVGARVYQGEARIQSDTTTACRFAGAEGGVVAVLVRRIPQEKWASEQIDRMQRNPRSFRELPGMGERAFLYDLNGTGAVLCVFRGGYYMQLSVFRMGGAPKARAAVEVLARKCLTRVEKIAEGFALSSRPGSFRPDL
jgi:hypothetical protein